MKLSNLSKIAGVGILTLSTAILPATMPASAQTTTTPGGTDTQTGIQTEQRRDVEGTDDGFDWGWLGLIGLAGLFGLAGKNRRQEPTAYRDPNSTVGTTGYRE